MDLRPLAFKGWVELRLWTAPYLARAGFGAGFEASSLLVYCMAHTVADADADADAP